MPATKKSETYPKTYLERSKRNRDQFREAVIAFVDDYLTEASGDQTPDSLGGCVRDFGAYIECLDDDQVRRTVRAAKRAD